MSAAEIRLIVGIVFLVGSAFTIRREVVRLRESPSRSFREAVVDMLFDLPPTLPFAVVFFLIGGGLVGSYWNAAV